MTAPPPQPPSNTKVPYILPHAMYLFCNAVRQYSE